MRFVVALILVVVTGGAHWRLRTGVPTAIKLGNADERLAANARAPLRLGR